jgi:hypothetical protein
LVKKGVLRSQGEGYKKKYQAAVYLTVSLGKPVYNPKAAGKLQKDILAFLRARPNPKERITAQDMLKDPRFKRTTPKKFYDAAQELSRKGLAGVIMGHKGSSLEFDPTTMKLRADIGMY